MEWLTTGAEAIKAMFSDGKVTGEFKKRIEEKKDIWSSLEHRHLMRIYSVDLTRLPKAMFIVMEFAAGGSLYKTLRSLGSGNKLPIYVVTDWAKQIAEGMLYLHQKKIVHRDLKSSNILLMEPFYIRNSYAKVTLKIADFDEVKEHDHTTTMSFVGTCAYMAPEVLKDARFSKASDVWSFGVVVWEMLSGDIPYKELQQRQIIHKSIVGELNRPNLPVEQSFPEDYRLLLNRCWESTCRERLSFKEIFSILQRMTAEIAEFEAFLRNHPNGQILDARNAEVLYKREINVPLNRGNTDHADAESCSYAEREDGAAVSVKEDPYSHMTYGMKESLRNCRVILLACIIVDTVVLSVLNTNNTITDEMGQMIQNQPTPSSKAGKLLDFLPKRPRLSYKTFVFALVFTRQSHLAQLINRELTEEYQAYVESGGSVVEKVLSFGCL